MNTVGAASPSAGAYTYIHTYIRTYIHTHTHTYIYIYIRLYTYVMLHYVYIQATPVSAVDRGPKKIWKIKEIHGS